MANDEELKKNAEETKGEEAPAADAESSIGTSEPSVDESEAETAALALKDSPHGEKPKGDSGGGSTPVQLGYRRYVFAAYMAAAIAIAFLMTKVVDYAWFKLAQFKPEWFVTIGMEPRDEIVVVLSGVVGASTAIYYWRNKRVHTLIEEIAEELTRVTWPSRQEVTNSTTVVIIATAFATIFFALMDQFWLWVTKHVYGS